MAERKVKERKSVLPWGMSVEGLQPSSVQAIPQSKLKAFSLGRTNPLTKANPFSKRKEEREEKKKIEANEAAAVFENFLASFEEPSKTGKTFVRGSTIDPSSTGEDSSSGGGGSIYKPSSRFLKAKEEKEESQPPPISTVHGSKKLPKKKGAEKKKSILELFREELKRAQVERKERHAAKEAGSLPLDAPDTTSDIFKVDEYKDFLKGSFDTGDPLTTNLYVGNINPKMNEEMLCQTFGKFGPLASVKVMWPRTEEERARNRNCGFVAYMTRADADKALDAMKGTTIMEYEIQVGWGKAVPLPPHPIYVPPDMQEEENAKVPDPPSGLPFNAQVKKKHSGSSGQYGTVPPPGGSKEKEEESFEDLLYNSTVRVVIPTDIDLLQLIHRMIEFVIREGPMFEAMIMNKELNSPLFQFLFDNQSPAHVYYRWKLFSILNGDSPETWRTEEFRMFEAGSVWKPPPLKNLRSKVLPPIEEVMKKGQLSNKSRDDLEDQLRSISMEREQIKTSMVWCMDHAESADEIVECVTESLCISATPLPMKIARLYLVNDILQNSSASIPNASNFRRKFEAKLLVIMEHFHTVLKGITSRMRAEAFKRRVLSCIRAWDRMSVYHFNLVDKLRETFIGKTREELEKQKAFETVAALISTGKPEESSDTDLDGVPLLDTKPIDFSGGTSIDGVPMGEDLDGEPLPDADLDGVPLGQEDIDGVPMEEEPKKPAAATAQVRSKWELVDYGDDSDEDEPSGTSPTHGAGEGGGLGEKERQQLLAELDQKKRKILREVEMKVVELSDALEATGSYSKAEIADRVKKYRERLMQEAVEPKHSPPRSPVKGSKSKSPSPSVLAKYDLEGSPKASKQERKHQSPERSKKSPSPSKQRHFSSPSRKRRHSSRSPSPKSHHPRSQSPSSKKRKHSQSPKRKRSPSHSPVRRSRSRSRSPTRKSPSRKSPIRKRSHSRSRSPRRKSRSRSPRQKFQSRSPRRKSRSKSPRRKSRSRSPKRRSRSPVRRRSRSRSPKHSGSRHRSRSKSPRSHKRRSRSRSPKSSSKKSSKRRSRSPYKSSKSSSKSKR